MNRRLVIVVRADPVICGHAGEARNLAEVDVTWGFADVRLLSWPIPVLQAAGLPMKPLDTIQPYSPGAVERPDPVGDYRVPDGRFTAGLAGRLFELFTDGVPTICLSMYLNPHTNVVIGALRAALAAGVAGVVTTIAEAVGSDITNIVRSSISEGRYGAAAVLFTTYLANDRCVAVSRYTRDLIVESARQVDQVCGTHFAAECERRVGVSYPAAECERRVGVSYPADATRMWISTRRRSTLRCGVAGCNETDTSYSPRGSRPPSAPTTWSPRSGPRPPAVRGGSSSAGPAPRSPMPERRRRAMTG